MKWYHNLFLGEKAAPKYKQTVRKIKNRKLTPNIYVIAFPSNPQNLLDIIPTWELMQSGYPKEHVRIIGIADGKREAFEVTRQIVDEVYQKTGTTNVKEYLLAEWREDLCR
uniref:hypothetical protein n=1 Tax=Agathobacter sp. TaxID=2021311 RepID=UPI0040560523